MDIVQLEYWNQWTGQCPLSPWKLSTESMDSVDNVHGLSGHCLVSFWAFPHTLYIGQCIVKECLCSVNFYFMTYAMPTVYVHQY